MIVFGIDPGTQAGWAVLDSAGNRIASGWWDLRPKLHEGGGMRYVRLQHYLDELRETYKPARVGYEQPGHFAGKSAADVILGVVAHVQAWCERVELPYLGIPVARVKKHATGRGNADKPAMVAAARAKWAPYVVTNDNEADALWIGSTLLAEIA